MTTDTRKQDLDFARQLEAIARELVDDEHDYITLVHPAGTRYRIRRTRARVTWLAQQFRSGGFAKPRPLPRTPVPRSSVSSHKRLLRDFVESGEHGNVVALLDADPDLRETVGFRQLLISNGGRTPARLAGDILLDVSRVTICGRELLVGLAWSPREARWSWNITEPESGFKVFAVDDASRSARDECIRRARARAEEAAARYPQEDAMWEDLLDRALKQVNATRPEDPLSRLPGQKGYEALYRELATEED